jgi:hypothetical protein
MLMINLLIFFFFYSNLSLFIILFLIAYAVPSSNSFTLYAGYNVSATCYANNFLQQYKTSHKLECLASCNRISGCTIATLNTQSMQCTFFGNQTCDSISSTAVPLNLFSKTQLTVVWGRLGRS